MKVEYISPDTYSGSFPGQECPWVVPQTDGGIEVTYYESNPKMCEGKPVGQKRLVLTLNPTEREQLKALL